MSRNEPAQEAAQALEGAEHYRAEDDGAAGAAFGEEFDSCHALRLPGQDEAQIKIAYGA